MTTSIWPVAVCVMFVVVGLLCLIWPGAIEHVALTRLSQYERWPIRQFGQIEDQFAQIDRRFTALHRYMEERFLEVDRRFDRVDERFQEMLGHFDEI